MANVFNTQKEIHKRYDLKGSTYGRLTKSDDPSVPRKDLNWMNDGKKLVLSKDLIVKINKILESDS